MRMSCNGCRVLRKGCGESCILRPCLHWISTPESQANATIFLAKFYGRAGLTNLITNGPEHLRPAIFRSLLFEACGRMMNPIHGSVGLLSSGNWALCREGVENILRGSFPSITPDSSAARAVRMETTAFRELHRSVTTRGKLKGLSHSKARRKLREHASTTSHMDSSCKSHDDLGDVTNNLKRAAENCPINEKYIEKSSTIWSAGEVDEFIAADQAQMEYCHGLPNLKTSHTEVEAPCSPVGLELTLGSQEYFPRTPDKSLAFDLRCSEAFWNQCMENSLP